MTDIKEVQVSRNPFARHDVMRRVVETKPCAWCGHDAKFQYGVLLDGIETLAYYGRHVFCNIICWRSYND